MEYEKHIKRLVLGYLKKECKYTYKVFLKYNFHSKNKHIPTRVAGQTLEDILRIYSRIEEIVQGHLEDTNYYKDKSAEFSSPIFLDNQLLYLLEKDRPFTPASTPCPRSPAESSVVESHHENEAFTNHISDVETTPEHSLPGNMSSRENNYQSKTPCREEFKSPGVPCLERMSTSDKASEVMTLKVPEKVESRKKLSNNTSIGLNTPEIPCFSHRGENEKNKEGVGTELDYMFQDFLGTPVSNTVNKAVESTPTSSHFIHSTTPSRNWQYIDDHNNRAVSSILAAVNTPNNKPSNLVTAASDNNAIYDENVNNFQKPPVSSTIQTVPVSTNYTNSQYLLPTTMGMYLVPQPTTSTIQSGNQQPIYIVNPPMVIPQQTPMMQVLQPIAPANNNNKKDPTSKNNMHLSEEDIMSMPTIILNEHNEITYADPGSFPTKTPFKNNEAHNIKEYINLFGSSDKSPVLKLSSNKKRIKYQPPIKPTTTIKVEVFQRDTAFSDNAKTIEATESSNNNAQNTSDEVKIVSVDGLPSLNETAESEPVKRKHEEPTKVNKGLSDTETHDTKASSHDKIKSMVAAVTPSPLKSKVRKPTPKSGSHVRNLTFPSPIRRTSEKPEAKSNSPRAINKQQATKDLFGSENDEENISSAKKDKARKSARMVRTPKTAERSSKKAKKEAIKSPKKVKAKDKTKPSKKITKKEAIEENTSTHIEEEDLTKKCSWDSNLRKLIPPVIEENNATPPRRTSARRKARQSTELDVSDPDGKKLEEALKTPDKIEKPKRKTPSRKKKVETLNNKKSEENLETQDEETKGETKVLSPSKLNANKRNILSNDVDDVTPSTINKCSQYPITSKTRRNISSLLETPMKEDLVPPTPGTVPDKTDTPFTPMLRANLKDFTEGDTFSINTPNFPVTPGLAVMVNQSAAYYILNDNENNKVTEATVLQEEKKSSVRKSDDEEVELSPRIYGSKDILENFNKSRIGKKNLELLDNRGVTWDGSSDREEKSGDNSENNSDYESNNTVIQNQKVESADEINLKKRRTLGKCMATLQSQILKEINNPSERFTHVSVSKSQENLNTDSPDDKEDKSDGQSTKDKQESSKITKTCSSDSDNEVLSKKIYAQKKNNQTGKDIPVSMAESDSNITFNTTRKNESIIEESSEHVTSLKCSTTQEIRQAISGVCIGNTLDRKSTCLSLKAQLEEKKKRWIELENANKSLDGRKTCSKRAIIKPSSNLNPVGGKRKPPNPRKVVKNIGSNKESEKNNADDVKESIETKKRTEIKTENADVDSQDEFFKKSGTNLHRKNKGTAQTSKEDTDTRMDGDNLSAKSKSSTEKICKKDKKLKDGQKLLKGKQETEIAKSNNQEVVGVQEEREELLSTELDNPNEFEKSWEDCRINEIQTILDCCHDESNRPNKKLEDYDLSITQKKILIGVPCSDGSTVNITLKCSSFDTLLEFKSSEEFERTDGSKDEVDFSFELEHKADIISDSENPGNKTENADPRCAKKRKHRSDSCNSNSSAKRMKKNEIFNATNIQKLLTKIHGPGPSNQ